MMNGCKLSPCALGLSFGLLWGISILIMGLVATYYAYGHDFVISMGSLYPGYTPSIKGSFLGALIGFLDAFIMGFIIAWLYNRFNCCKCTCCAQPEEKPVIRERKVRAKTKE